MDLSALTILRPGFESLAQQLCFLVSLVSDAHTIAPEASAERYGRGDLLPLPFLFCRGGSIVSVGMYWETLSFTRLGD